MRVLVSSATLCAFVAAHADNAALTSGGIPSMMSAHPSISMVSEVVHVTIHSDRVDTDCSFVFKNEGPACNVNMGFPDFGMWAYGERKPNGSFFRKFQSYVDGKPVKTKLVLGKGHGEQWQTKIVPFDRNGTRVVREVYSSEPGGVNDQYESGSIMEAASYILHTGSSWHKPIGSAKVVFTIAPDTEMTAPLNVRFLKPKEDPGKGFLQNFKTADFVAVNGPMPPKVDGLTLTFEKSNWRPTQDDDIVLLFRFSPTALVKMKAEADSAMKKSRKSAGKH